MDSARPSAIFHEFAADAAPTPRVINGKGAKPARLRVDLTGADGADHVTLFTRDHQLCARDGLSRLQGVSCAPRHPATNEGLNPSPSVLGPEVPGMVPSR